MLVVLGDAGGGAGGTRVVVLVFRWCSGSSDAGGGTRVVVLVFRGCSDSSDAGGGAGGAGSVSVTSAAIGRGGRGITSHSGGGDSLRNTTVLNVKDGGVSAGGGKRGDGGRRAEGAGMREEEGGMGK